MELSAGLRRLLTAWVVFGVLFATDVTTIAVAHKGSPWHGLADCAGLGAFTWALLESFCGPWARERQSRPDTSRRTAEVVGDYVAAQLRSAADDDGDGAATRRCC